MKQIKARCIVFFLILGVAFHLQAQLPTSLPELQPSYSHDFLQGKEGVRVDCISNVYKDRKGRIWYKTCGQAVTKGLLMLQYDGYRHEPLTYMQDQAESPDQAELEELIAYDFKFFDLVSDNQVFGSYNHKEDGTGGVFLMDLTTRKVHFPPTKGLNEGLYDLRYRSDSSLLITTVRKGEVAIHALANHQLDTLLVFQHPNLSEPDLSPEYGALYTEQTLWFYFRGLPLVAVDLATKSKRSFTIADFPQQDQLRLSQELQQRPYGFEFAVMDSGKLYVRIGPDFFQYDEGADRFLPLQRDFIQGYKALGLYQDQSQNICFFWEDGSGQRQAVVEDAQGTPYNYSTFFEGVSPNNLQAVLAKDFFRELMISETGSLRSIYVQERSAVQNALDGYFISSTMEQLDGSFLVNTVFDGWFQLSADGSQSKALKQPVECSTELLSSGASMVQQIIPDTEDNLWWIKSGRLYQYHLPSKTCQTHDLSFGSAKGAKSLALFARLEERKFVFTNWGNELLFFDLDKGQSFVPGGTIPRRLSGKIYDFMVGQEGILWVPTADGLYKLDWKNQQGSRIGKEVGFGQEIFQCIYQEDAGRLWLGTAANGIYIYNPKTSLIEKVITQDQGLAYNSIMSIFPDQQGDIWVTTENGINVLSSEGEVIGILDTNEGLNDNLFNRFDPFVAKDGRILVGNQKGLNIIDPVAVKSLLQRDQGQKRIFLTEMRYYDEAAGEEVSYAPHELPSKVVHLPADHRNLNLSFGISTYVEPNRHNYAYRLLGLEEDWNYLGPQHTLNLASLPAGRYTLQIKAGDFRNNWSVNWLEIPIQAEEFFYKTIWFYLLCVALLLGLGLAWVYRIRRDKIVLEATVASRTQQIQAQAEQLKKLDQFKSRLFSNISHEFRTPLTIMSGMLDQIEKNPKDWLKKGVGMIRKNNANLLDLVNQMLELQKVESGNLKINWQQGDIVPFLRNIFEQFRAYAQSKQQHLEFVAAEESVQMDYDSEKVLRIVSNLLSNAIKFTPEQGQVTFVVSTGTNKALASAHCLVLAVKDTGPGIPKDQVARIFDRFFQADSNELGTGTGTGIGLSLIQELVQLFQGKIEVSSEEGNGTTFKVFLPITQKAAPGQSEDQLSIPTAVFGVKGPIEKQRLSAADYPIALVVEDNLDIASYLQLCLEERYQLQFATNGQEGIDRACEEIPDIIISDVMMPEKDGFELCETLKEDVRTSHIPIILLTAKSDVESRLKGLKHGADDYLAKPFNEEELLVRMQNLLQLRRKLQERYQDVYAQPLPLAKMAEPTIEDAFIQKVREILEDRMIDPGFDLDSLSSALNLSRSNLYRKIKALTGRSPAVYLRSLRLQKARQILQSSDVSVKQVAYDVGFSDPSYFSRSYTEEFGESPSHTGL